MKFLIWYLLTADLFVIAFGCISTRSPAGTAIGVVAAAAGVTVLILTVRARGRYKRSGIEPLRAELLTLLRQRAGTRKAPTAWLNRDKHLVFAAWYNRTLIVDEWELARADEDQADLLLEADSMESGALSGEPERVALTSDTYQVTGFVPYVTQLTVGGIAVIDSEGNVELERPEKVKLFRFAVKYVKTMRTGMLYAGAGELRELIDQFREAEPLEGEII